MLDLRRISCGGTAALVTSMGLIVGLKATSAPEGALVGSLLIGVLLLRGLSYLIARRRGVSPVSEIAKHLAAAALVIIASGLIGAWVESLPTGRWAN